MDRFFLAAVLLLSAGTGLAETGGATLKDCYGWALSRSESLKVREEDILQAEARARSAFGGLFPKLGWDLSSTWQDPKGVDRLNSQGFSGFIEKEQTESKFSLRQPLFSGFKEWSAFSGFRKQEARDAFLLKRASRELFERTASAFYGVVGAETERDNTRASYDLAIDRVHELGGFVRLGKARDSEVFTAQAHAAAIRASLKQLEARIAAAREELSLVTGQDLRRRPLADELSDRPPFGALDEALGRAARRADVLAQKEEVAARELQVRFERAAYWPTLDVLGKYYTRRATFMKEIKWDATLTLQVPLFSGGSVSSDVRRASSAHRQALLALEELERSVDYAVRRLHGDLASAVDEALALGEAAGAAEKSYKALLKEYRLGLVTNLDVLQALDLLQAQRSAFAAARLRTKVLFLRLGVATETLP